MFASTMSAVDTVSMPGAVTRSCREKEGQVKHPQGLREVLLSFDLASSRDLIRVRKPTPFVSFEISVH